MDVIPNNQPYVALVKDPEDEGLVHRVPVAAWWANHALISNPHTADGALTYAKDVDGFLGVAVYPVTEPKHLAYRTEVPVRDNMFIR